MSNLTDIEHSIKDKENPNSLVNITPSAISDRIRAIPDDILSLEDAELEAQAKVNTTEEKLRVAWMVEQERAIRTGKSMNPSNIYLGICTKKYFYSYIVGNSYKLAYIIKPFVEYEIALEDILQLGLKRRRAVLALNPIEKDGKINIALARIQDDITKDVMDRRKGQSVQKIESKTQSLVLTKDVTPNDISAIDQRIAELEGREVTAITHEPQKEL